MLLEPFKIESLRFVGMSSVVKEPIANYRYNISDRSCKAPEVL